MISCIFLVYTFCLEGWEARQEGQRRSRLGSSKYSTRFRYIIKERVISPQKELDYYYKETWLYMAMADSVVT